MRLTAPRLAAIVAGIALVASSTALLATPDHPANAFPTTFANPRVDVLADGKVVINFDTAGEHKGIVTFNLAPGANGFLQGDWALVVRYADNTDPATGLEPPHHHQEPGDAAPGADTGSTHRDFARYIDLGTVYGTIDVAAIDIDADGRLVDFRAQLKVVNGTMSFEGSAGTGMAELTRGLAFALTGGQR